MISKKLSFWIAFILAAATFSTVNVKAADYTCKDIDALQYTYEIYPLIEPFNEYFYIKTDNPHPESFRFSDKDSPYSESSVIENVDKLYADVEYENTAWYRVNGGYIFNSMTCNQSGMKSAKSVLPTNLS